MVYWTWDKKKASNEIELLVGHEVKGRRTIFRKSYAMQDGEVVQRQLKSIWLGRKISTERGQEVVNSLFETDEKIFQGPKSPWLVETFLQPPSAWMEKHIYLIEPGLSDKGISALFDKFETEGSFNPGNVVVFGYSFSWTRLEALKNNSGR